MSFHKIQTNLAALGLLLLSATPAFSELEYVSIPTKEELRSIQRQAFTCSRTNDAEACRRTRQMVDPLMDHPRLPSSCKDVVWDLLQVAKTASKNSFQRRDSIDSPARRLSVICINPTRQKSPNPSNQGGLVPQQS